MRTYDHEPALEELIAQLKDEYAYLPCFINAESLPEPVVKNIQAGMVEQYIENL